MKTKLILKTSMNKLEEVRRELWKNHDSRGKMSQWRYVVDDMCYVFVFLPIHVQWEKLHGYRVDEMDMDDVLERLRELELRAMEISMCLMRK